MTRGPLLRPEPAGAEFVTLLTPPDWAAVFSGPGPLELEVGSGRRGLRPRPRRPAPRVRLRCGNRVAKKYARELEHRARARGLSNLRWWRPTPGPSSPGSSPRAASPSSTSSSPTPWWKRAHRKRAILTPGFTRLLLSLRPSCRGACSTSDRRRCRGRGDARHPRRRRMARPARARSFHPARSRGRPSSRERRYLESRGSRCTGPGSRSAQALLISPSGVFDACARGRGCRTMRPGRASSPRPAAPGQRRLSPLPGRHAGGCVPEPALCGAARRRRTHALPALGAESVGWWRGRRTWRGPHAGSLRARCRWTSSRPSRGRRARRRCRCKSDDGRTRGAGGDGPGRGAGGPSGQGGRALAGRHPRLEKRADG